MEDIPGSQEGSELLHELLGPKYTSYDLSDYSEYFQALEQQFITEDVNCFEDLITISIPNNNGRFQFQNPTAFPSPVSLTPVVSSVFSSKVRHQTTVTLLNGSSLTQGQGQPLIFDPSRAQSSTSSGGVVQVLPISFLTKSKSASRTTQGAASNRSRKPKTVTVKKSASETTKPKPPRKRKLPENDQDQIIKDDSAKKRRAIAAKARRERKKREVEEELRLQKSLLTLKTLM